MLQRPCITIGRADIAQAKRGKREAENQGGRDQPDDDDDDEVGAWRFPLRELLLMQCVSVFLCTAMHWHRTTAKQSYLCLV